jgi:hypothetical protein
VNLSTSPATLLTPLTQLRRPKNPPLLLELIKTETATVTVTVIGTTIETARETETAIITVIILAITALLAPTRQAEIGTAPISVATPDPATPAVGTPADNIVLPAGVVAEATAHEDTAAARAMMLILLEAITAPTYRMTKTAILQPLSLAYWNVNAQSTNLPLSNFSWNYNEESSSACSKHRNFKPCARSSFAPILQHL